MSVATCPHCEGQVTLPPGARPAARVKCPLCEAEYALSEIYEKLPPMLVLLEAPVEAEVVAGGGVSHGASAFDSLFMPSGEANGEGELHLAGDEEPAFDFGAPSEGGTAVATAPSTKTLPARAKRPPKSAAKEGIKIVLGGVVGLTIGYFILLWAAGRDLADDVANKPIGTVMPSWMQWSLPPAHRHPKPAATNGNPPAEDQGASADENASDANAADANAADEGAADGDATPNDAPQDDVPKDDASGDSATDAPGDATPSAETPTDSPKPDDMPPSDTPADNPPADNPPADNPPADNPPAEAKPEPKPETTPPKSPATTPPTDDPGLNVGPKPEFQVEEPKLDPLPGDPPSDASKPDGPKTDEPKPVEPKVDEPKVDEPPADAPPADVPPADAPDDNPFDIKPDETPKPDDAPKPDSPVADPPVADPTDTPDDVPSDKPDDQPKDKPADEPKEPEPSKPAAGLKVETPVDEATIASARSAASGALDTLMPSDAAAKAGFTREKYASYTKLCEYAQGVSHSAADVAATNAEAAKMMVLMVAADDADNRVLGQLANAWLSKTRANDGIALSGKVSAVDTAGGLTTISVELPALGEKLAARTATIVTRETTDVSAGDEVAAVGSVVDKPTEKIEGYAGADAQVIWGAWVGKRGG